jgi:hypothetical protein
LDDVPGETGVTYPRKMLHIFRGGGLSHRFARASTGDSV